MRNEQAWFKEKWRRILVDMHIPDWDPIFLNKLDPKHYVDMMEAGGATGAMVYANSHVGLCNYPTKVGKMHQGLRGRDFFGEVLELCHKRNLAVIAYYSLIFNNWAYVEHPDWRTIAWGWHQSGRYGTCCPNSPYRDFALSQTEEICSKYDCEGIFFDMTFWTGVCYCPHCIARYRREEGLEPPRVVDWHNPEWVRFQRARERWLDEFTGVVTKNVRSVNPKMTVTHQFSTVLADWRFGVPFSMAEHCDYLSGDFYGEAIQQSIVCKIFFSLSSKRPFEFHTSRCLDLTDHVTMKSPQRLETQAFIAPAHSSAFMFIDAINPDGTLNESVYTQIRSIFDKMSSYEPELGGKLCADVGVYFSQESKFDPKDNGTHITQLKPHTMSRMPHWEAVLGSCSSLKMSHIPFGIVTKHNLSELSNYQVLVLPDVLVMDKDEIKAVKDFVSSGGSLYASYRTSLNRTDGTTISDFMLDDVFGASLLKGDVHGLTYFTPIDNRLKKWFAPQDHMIHPEGQVSVKTLSAEVLATRTLPYTDPEKGEIFGKTFSSIHSNPPGPSGKEPSIIFNKFGKGHVIYTTGALESIDHDINRRVFTNLLRLLLQRPVWFEAQAHHAIEVVLFNQTERKRMLISLLNTQDELSSIPFKVDLRAHVPEGFKPLRLVQFPGYETIPYSVRDGYVEARIDDIKIFTMLVLEYQ